MNPHGPDERDEPAAIAARYARRAGDDRYHPLKPDVWQSSQERQRAMLALFDAAGWDDLATRRVCEVGCGAGGNLLELLRLGCRPEHLCGIELLSQRHALARQVLPQATDVRLGDAMHAALAAGSQDLVLLSTVLSSLLDDDYQQRLAQTLWGWLRPGGAVLCYDLAVDNPRNSDVRGVPLRRLRELFPGAGITQRRVTLAPPLARALCRVHPSLYTVFNSLPWLRTHRLSWIRKAP